jgi:hypothetical protein
MNVKKSVKKSCIKPEINYSSEERIVMNCKEKVSLVSFKK